MPTVGMRTASGFSTTDLLDSNQAVTPDAFVKGNLNYKVWGMASGIVDERWEGNWPLQCGILTNDGAAF
jgi:hypothetical protein